MFLPLKSMVNFVHICFGVQSLLDVNNYFIIFMYFVALNGWFKLDCLKNEPSLPHALFGHPADEEKLTNHVDWNNK